jgi:hypothetical protein
MLGLMVACCLLVLLLFCMLTLLLLSCHCCVAAMCFADKLAQTKLREKEIKEALKEKKQAEKEEKEEVSPASSLHSNSHQNGTLVLVNAQRCLVNMPLVLPISYCAARAVACVYL